MLQPRHHNKAFIPNFWDQLTNLLKEVMYYMYYPQANHGKQVLTNQVDANNETN